MDRNKIVDGFCYLLAIAVIVWFAIYAFGPLIKATAACAGVPGCLAGR